MKKTVRIAMNIIVLLLVLLVIVLNILQLYQVPLPINSDLLPLLTITATASVLSAFGTGEVPVKFLKSVSKYQFPVSFVLCLLCTILLFVPEISPVVNDTLFPIVVVDIGLLAVIKVYLLVRNNQ